jgi:predicted dehydrogenase
MDRTRIAVVGLGMAVKPHARSLLDLADRVEVAGCFSPTEARRAAFARDWGLPVTDDLDGLIADPTVTAVMILTPPATHLELVERAAAAGKHILLEKPLEISTARAERLVAAADAAGVTLGVESDCLCRAARRCASAGDRPGAVGSGARQDHDGGAKGRADPRRLGQG